jgi:hypothetical protein
MSHSSEQSRDMMSHFIAQAMSAELYLSHFANKDDCDDYNQSLLAFTSAWQDLIQARCSEEFIPSVAVSH